MFFCANWREGAQALAYRLFHCYWGRVILVLLGLLFQLIGVACGVVILAHAFQRSLGTGVMVLLIPVYNVVYAFTQFEHRWKGPIVAGAIGGLTFGVLLRLYGLALV